MTYKEFSIAIKKLKAFMNLQDKAEKALRLAFGEGFNFDFGNKFIDDYITVLSKAVGDEYGWVSWYVFDNDWGKNDMSVRFGGGELVHCSDLKTLYDCINESK